jgi:hypothetical protein
MSAAHAVFDEGARTPDGRPRLALLALSGGGARGAFGAGLLTGWTRSGTRPRFAAVTGISTGALMGTFAFLGPQYDGELERFYTATTDADIFADRGVSGLLRDAVKDSGPLKRLIERTMDERILDAVAGEHHRGRRFLVGTTNLDSARLVVWDMGAIAASGRPDRQQRFRDVLLASASVPMVFPPVYFPVEWEGKTYWQMHVDGGAAVIVFLSGFVIDELNRMTGLKAERGDAAVDFYIVLNDVLGDRGDGDPACAPVSRHPRHRLRIPFREHPGRLSLPAAGDPLRAGEDAPPVRLFPGACRRRLPVGGASTQPGPARGRDARAGPVGEAATAGELGDANACASARLVAALRVRPGQEMIPGVLS